MAVTPRLGLRRPQGADAFLPTQDITNHADVLDAAALDQQGTFAERPAATAVPDGTYYFVSDTEITYRSDGTNWKAVGVRPAGDIDGAEISAGAIDADHLADAARLGLTDDSTVRRGKSIVSGEQVAASSSLSFLGTPDRVQNIVLPTDGLIFALYQATWKSSVAFAGSAELFLDNEPVRVADGKAGGDPAELAAFTGGTADAYGPLYSTPLGLRSFNGNPDSAYTGDVTTGQVVGGMVWGPSTSSVSSYANAKRFEGGGWMSIFAAAGTYDVGVKFAAASGSVSVKNRKLWVWTMAF